MFDLKQGVQDRYNAVRWRDVPTPLLARIKEDVNQDWRWGWEWAWAFQANRAASPAPPPFCPLPRLGDMEVFSPENTWFGLLG